MGNTVRGTYTRVLVNLTSSLLGSIPSSLVRRTFFR